MNEAGLSKGASDTDKSRGRTFECDCVQRREEGIESPEKHHTEGTMDEVVPKEDYRRNQLYQQGSHSGKM